jgi:hypothetical protein
LVVDGEGPFSAAKDERGMPSKRTRSRARIRLMIRRWGEGMGERIEADHLS